MMGWQGRNFFWWVVIFILFLLPEIYASKANGRSSSLRAPSIIQGKNDDIQAVNAPEMDMASLASPGNQVPFKATSPTPVLSKVKEFSNLFHVPLASDVHPSGPLAISPSQQEVKEPFSITHSPLASDPPVIIPAEQGVKNPSGITPVSQQHSSGSAPATHPVPLEVKPPSIAPHGPSVSHSQPPGSSPMVVHEPHEETEPPNITNVTHAPLHSPLRPSGSSSPAISPRAQEVKEASNFTHAPLALHLHPSGVSPAISPVQKEVKVPSNNMHAPLASQSNPSSSSPVMSPAPHEVKGTPNVTDAPLGSPSDSLASYPVTSPVPHEGRNFSNSTVAPSASQTNSSGRIIQSPSSVPIPPIPPSRTSPVMSPAPHEVKGIPGASPVTEPPIVTNVTHAPLPSPLRPSGSSSPAISPGAQEVKEASNFTHAPSALHLHPSGVSPAISPVQKEVKVPSNNMHAPLASQSNPSRSSPVMSPAPHEVKGTPNVTDAPLGSPPDLLASYPVTSPLPHEGRNFSNSTVAPSASKTNSSGRIIQSPSSVPIPPIPPSRTSPVMSPAPHEVKGIPGASPVTEPPIVTNVTHAPLPSPLRPSGSSSPAISPGAQEVKEASNFTHAPSALHLHPSGVSPAISPVQKEVKDPSNNMHAPLASQSNPSRSSPVMSPAPHEVKGSPNVTDAPLGSPPDLLKSYPVTSPVPHEGRNFSKSTVAPSASQTNSSGRIIQSPPSVPIPPIPHSSELSPMMSPAPHEVEIPNVTYAPKASHSHPSESPPVISPSQHDVNNHSNNAHAPLVSQPPPSGRAIQSPSSVPPIPIPRSSEVAPVMCPAPREVEIPNVTRAPTASHPHPLESPPVISPTSHEVNKPPNKVQAPAASYPPPFAKIIQSPSSAPVLSIPQRRRRRTGKPAHAASHPHTSVSPPVISPSLHEGKNPSNNAHAPLAFHSTPSGRIIQSPSSVPMPSNSQHSTRINIGEHAPRASRPHPLESSPVISPTLHGVNNPNNAHAPLASHPPPSSGRKIQSPSSAPIASTPQHITRIRIGNPVSAPLSPPHPASHHPGRVISPAPSPPAPEVFPKNKTIRPSPPPIIQGPSLSSVHAPEHPPEVFSNNYRRHRAPSNNQGPSHSPTLPPSGSFSKKQRAPFPSPLWLLPPPPPNLDCKSLTCLEPLTYPPPGSLCVCVLPIKVGLRLRVALYTFFPLVSEFAKEIVAGVFMKQSQVRIMGANADSEDPEKTIVIIYLVPLGGTFDINTALLVYERFFLKQVLISALYFGDYDVLYVTYPGLPPSPPGAPENYDTAGGAFGNGKKRPLAVDPTKNKEKLSGSLIAIIVLSSIISLVLSIGAAWLLLLKCRARSSLPASTSQSLPLPFAKSSATGLVISRPSSTSASLSSSVAAYTGSTRTFSLAEIERATDRFHDSRIIGEGGFGRVYNALLDDRTMVAVKVLKREDQQGGREFLAEVEMLSRLHHRNLVKLVGICTEENARCLVYELIPNGSVESHLHGADKENAPLDWSARIKIALGAARGLAYLHEDSSPRVIHRDFKSSNILLEHDFTPKVSDFGLARTALDEGNEHISTRVMGTFGYVAPEYAMTGHLLVKSDVYSYGVVLLELLTGRKPVDMSQPPGQENLVSWALPLLTSIESLKAIIDPTLGTDIPSDSIAKVAAIASMCVQPEVSHRPFMSEVVQALKLVSNEGDEYKSESGTEAELSTKGSDIRINTGMGLEEERVLSESDIFCTSARFTTDASGSFRRYASSGPLDTGRSGRLWQSVINFSSGSMREAAAARGSGTGIEGSEQWP